MINFTYKKEIEASIFDDYIKENKSPVVADMILDELKNVEINISEDFIKNQLNFISKQWEETQPKFLESLGKFYEENLQAPDLTCYLIRLNKFPYDYSKGWFTAPLFTNPAERNRVIMHELCHYYQPKPLPREIKEAIPEILNDHEKFRMFGFDKGHKHEKEQQWRKKIWQLYKNGGKFSDLLKLADKNIVDI